MNLFITGTNTDAGKTYVAIELLKMFNKQGLRTIGLKPVASGCEYIDGQLRNQDALLLQKTASIKLNYAAINPFTFEPPIAPHIAAKQVDCQLSVAELNAKMHAALNHPADVRIIEGAGGWQVPLNERETMADFALANDFLIILVVGMRLGCINHAILTAQSMQQQGARLLGWIANCVDVEMRNVEENVATLRDWLSVPLLGYVGHGSQLKTCWDDGLMTD